ncbi:MAG: GxxExxY protein [Pyrinomonadaceae bacterium]
MNADERGLKHKEITEKIFKVFFEVYNELGHGFLESVYEKALSLALNSAGLAVRRQMQIPVWFRGQKVGDFIGDVLVNESVLLELKAVRALDSSHEAQLLNYLRATDVEVGMLLNFGLKPEFKRMAFDNRRKQIRENPRLSAAILFSED